MILFFRNQLGIFLFSTIIMLASSQLFGKERLNIYVIRSEPLGFIDALGNPTGQHWDNTRAISSRSGIEMEMKIAPKARILADIKKGHIDGCILFRGGKRDNIIEYVEKIRTIKIIAINQKGLPLNRYEDLYNSKRIGVIRNTFFGKRFDLDSRLKLERSSKYEVMVRQLSKGRIDTATGNAIVLNYLFNKLNMLDKVEQPGIVLTQKEQWFQMSKKSKHLDKLPRIRQAIRELKADGTFDQILTRYTGDNWRVVNRID